MHAGAAIYADEFANAHPELVLAMDFRWLLGVANHVCAIELCVSFHSSSTFQNQNSHHQRRNAACLEKLK